VLKVVRKRTLQIYTNRFEANIKKDPKKSGWTSVGCTHLAKVWEQSYEHGNEPWGFIKGEEFLN
jgi:hypothetical protein